MKNKKEGFIGQNKIFIALTLMGIFVIGGYFILFNNKDVPISEPLPDPPIAISNPDYLKNSSAYLVDYDNKISSQIPTSKPLWVEEIVGSPVIKISYSIIKAGQNIIKIRNLGIPGIDYIRGSGSNQCLEKASVDFLNKNLLHKEVYLIREETKGWRLLMPAPNGKDTIDVAVFIIQNGYGNTPFWIPLYGKEKLDDDSFLPYPGFGRDYFSLVGYAKALQDELEVARLAKRGYWGMCQ